MAVVVVVVSALVGWAILKGTRSFYAERFEAQHSQIEALKGEVARLSDRQSRQPTVGPLVSHPTGEGEADVAKRVASANLHEKPTGLPEVRRPAATAMPKELPKEARTPRQEDSRPGVPPGGISAPNGVVSVNQQGGITAGNVNVNLPNPPLLTVAQGETIRAAIAAIEPKPVEISLGCYIADNASCNVTKQLATVMGQVGWKFSLAVLPVSAEGVLVEADEGLLAARALVEGLRRAGLRAALRARPGSQSRSISVIVGPTD